MTYLGLRCSRYINGVAMHHGEISHNMFPNYPIHATTDGVHAATWTSAPFRELYDRHVPKWRRDSLYLRDAIGIPLKEIRQAHSRAKYELLRSVAEATGVHLNESIATLEFARRAAEYKRADLFFSDFEPPARNPREVRTIPDYLRRQGAPKRRGGKSCHSENSSGGSCPARLYSGRVRRELRHALGRFVHCRSGSLVQHSAPFEASGTSGMKAAMNGVPSLSVRDGWWVEGHLEGITGWSIGDEEDPERHDIEIASVHEELGRVILPLYYSHSDGYAEVMRSAIANDGSFFNTQLMVAQYVSNAYYPRVDTSSGNNLRHDLAPGAEFARTV
jgi:starch phosphorylase